MSARHPMPWTVERGNGPREWCASPDANGDLVAPVYDEQTGREIVDAVHGRERLIGEIAAAAEIIRDYMGAYPGCWIRTSGWSATATRTRTPSSARGDERTRREHF